jgi:putative colanic acid biosynthesis UDP-glucose lipid carrier transferase
MIAWWIRFDLMNSVGSMPPSYVWSAGHYAQFLPGVLAVSATVFWFSGLYQSRRAQRLSRFVFGVLKAVGLGLLALSALLLYYRAFSFSRLHLGFFGVLTPALMIGMRLAAYTLVRRRRQQGKGLKHVLIVGAGTIGKRLARTFEQYPWMGLSVVGFLDDEKTGARVLGRVDEAAEVADRLKAAGTPVDYVYLALPLAAGKKMEHVVSTFATRTAHVHLVPDLFQFDIINSRVSDLDGLPIIHLIDETPLEFRRLVKRGVDIVFSGLVLLVISPLMLALALAVKLSSPGPVFYRQERMGLNGHCFDMLKFRSMPVDAEAGTGAVWASPGERRATRVGAFLRSTSLDELPQFFNVLRGDMSVVGPRPERPVFIEQFKDQIPGYMLRHKMKAGITGWAQVNGWRGSTSLERRIECDLYYIQNWSLLFDAKIIILTVFKGFVHQNAY